MTLCSFDIRHTSTIADALADSIHAIKDGDSNSLWIDNYQNKLKIA